MGACTSHSDYTGSEISYIRREGVKGGRGGRGRGEEGGKRGEGEGKGGDGRGGGERGKGEVQGTLSPPQTIPDL
jgi:hypothetical protein